MEFRGLVCTFLRWIKVDLCRNDRGQQVQYALDAGERLPPSAQSKRCVNNPRWCDSRAPLGNIGATEKRGGIAPSRRQGTCSRIGLAREDHNHRTAFGLFLRFLLRMTVLRNLGLGHSCCLSHLLTDFGKVLRLDERLKRTYRIAQL